MYNSPITQFMDNYVSDIQKQITEQKETKIMQTISETMGFDIDKQELIKALNYDREQYEKGYKDAEKKLIGIIQEIQDEILKNMEEVPEHKSFYHDGVYNGYFGALKILVEKTKEYRKDG